MYLLMNGPFALAYLIVKVQWYRSRTFIFNSSFHNLFRWQILLVSTKYVIKMNCHLWGSAAWTSVSYKMLKHVHCLDFEDKL